MRKADYAALAAIIAKKREYAQSMARNALTDQRREYVHGILEALHGTATQFADVASVNRAEFLKACGIEP